MGALPGFGWTGLIVAASLLPVLIAAVRKVQPVRRRLIGVLAVACMLARSLGYLAGAWSVWLLLLLTGVWGVLVLWAATAKTSVSIPATPVALRRRAGERAHLEHPATRLSHPDAGLSEASR